MRACLHTLGLAWAALCLPLRTELARRVALLCDDTGAGAGAGAHAADRRRATERLELLRRQVEATALKAARMVAQCVREAPSLAFLTQLRSENLERWVEVLRDARAEEDGGEGISREDRERDLRWCASSFSPKWLSRSRLTDDSSRTHQAPWRAQDDGLVLD